MRFGARQVVRRSGNPAGKKLAIAGVVGLVVVWLLVEIVFLRGTVVQRGTITLGTPYPLAVADGAARHTVEIGGRRRGKRQPKQRLHLRITDPNGVTLLDETESLVRGGSRVFSFSPGIRGKFTLEATNQSLAGRTGTSFPIVVTVGDRRFLTRLLF